MYSLLIQVLLPATDHQGHPFQDGVLAGVKQALVQKFGGLTAYTRSPAEGVWTSGVGHRERDEIIIVEVMASSLDEDWWKHFRKRLETELSQEEIVVRALHIRTPG